MKSVLQLFAVLLVLPDLRCCFLNSQTNPQAELRQSQKMSYCCPVRHSLACGAPFCGPLFDRTI